jgi:HEPN domain-containing protein
VLPRWLRVYLRRSSSTVTTDERRLADVGRMYREACSRIDDADFLAKHWPASACNSDHLLRVLGLEVLIKAVLKLAGADYPARGGGGHDYEALFNRLPQDARREVLKVAIYRMRGVTKEVYPNFVDISNGRGLNKVLRQSSEFFTSARYQYEFLEGHTQEEQRAIEQRWMERGGPSDEAHTVCYTEEVGALIAGLRAYIEARVPVELR